jgi:DNA-binding GntR family transcriptional regulator
VRAESITADRLGSLYELRWLLEPQALSQSAQVLPRERVRQARDKLRAALDDMPKLGSNTYIDLENDLHIVLLSGCPNHELLRVLERIRSLLVSNPHCLNFCVGQPHAHIESSLREHLQVLELSWTGIRERRQTPCACIQKSPAPTG